MVLFLVRSYGMKIVAKDILKREIGEHPDCGDDGTYLDQNICLENGYFKAAPPSQTNTTVHLYFRALHVRDVDDHKKTLTLETKLKEMWLDPRIKANFSKLERYKDLKVSQARNLIWKPSIRIQKMTNRKAMADSMEEQIFGLFPDDEFENNGIRVERIVRGRITVYCPPWKLGMYPLDDHSCHLRFFQRAPYNLTFVVSSDIKMKQDYIADGFKVSFSTINNNTVDYGDFDEREHAFSVLVKLDRKLQPFFISYYFPAIAIVCVSGSGFLLPTNPLTGRIGLGVTNFLTLTHLLIHETVGLLTFSQSKE